MRQCPLLMSYALVPSGGVHGCRPAPTEARSKLSGKFCRGPVVHVVGKQYDLRPIAGIELLHDLPDAGSALRILTPCVERLKRQQVGELKLSVVPLPRFEPTEARGGERPWPKSNGLDACALSYLCVLCSAFAHCRNRPIRHVGQTAVFDGVQFQGSSSSSRLIGWPLDRRLRISRR